LQGFVIRLFGFFFRGIATFPKLKQYSKVFNSSIGGIKEAYPILVVLNFF